MLRRLTQWHNWYISFPSPPPGPFCDYFHLSTRSGCGRGCAAIYLLSSEAGNGPVQFHGSLWRLLYRVFGPWPRQRLQRSGFSKDHSTHMRILAILCTLSILYPRELVWCAFQPNTMQLRHRVDHVHALTREITHTFRMSPRRCTYLLLYIGLITEIQLQFESW